MKRVNLTQIRRRWLKMSDKELEKIFDKRVIKLYSSAGNKQIFTKEDFEEVVECATHILQVESGEIKSNIPKIIASKILLSVLWAISFTLSARSLFILVREPSKFVFAGIPILVVAVIMFVIFINTLFCLLNFIGNYSVFKTIYKRRKTAKRKLEMLEMEGPYDKDGFIMDYKFLSLISLDISRIPIIPSYFRNIRTEDGKSPFTKIGGRKNGEV